MPDQPLAVDLCCGLGGWTEGLLEEGYRARGYDIEAHEYDDEKYPGELVLKSILDLDGAECADADLIVASPPCTEYSYMAMPWTRAKQIAAALRGDGEFPDGYRGSRTIAELNALFDACFRIQHQASAAKGRPIPMVLENVRGAEPWVGRARWNARAFYLWGDIPALMPTFDPGPKVPGFRFDGSGRSFQTSAVEGTKLGGSWFHGYAPGVQGPRNHGSGSKARKAASARIAKIPLRLSRYIAQVYKP